MDGAAFGGLAALSLSGCPGVIAEWRSLGLLMSLTRHSDLDLRGGISPGGGFFPQVTVSALASGSQGSLSLVLHIPKIWRSLTSGVGNPHTRPGRCSLVAKDPETLAAGAPVALGPGKLCVGIGTGSCRRALVPLNAWKAACFLSRVWAVLADGCEEKRSFLGPSMC